MDAGRVPAWGPRPAGVRPPALSPAAQMGGGPNTRVMNACLVLSLAADDLSRAQSGSSLSLASATTTEPESVHSGGAPSQR